MMFQSAIPRFLALTIFLCVASSAGAIPITGDSLHGATGELTIIDNGTNHILIWALDTTGFDDDEAVKTGREYLTDVAFKVSGMTHVELAPQSLDVGKLYYSTNINSSTNGCKTDGSPAGFACVTLDPMILATVDQVISVYFIVEGKLDLDAEIAFRGKYGDEDGWVISETGSFAVPEPSSALVFAIGVAVVGGRSLQRR
jgi:hypothetical protein